MIIDKLLDIAKIKYPAIIKDLEIGGYLETEEQIMLYLELYRLVSRQDIIDLYSSEEVLYVDAEDYILPRELEDRIYKLSSSNLFVYRYDHYTKHLITVTTQFSSITPSVGVYFSDLNFEILYITPLNYRILLGGPNEVYKLYDPLIFYKRVLYDAIENHASDIHIVNNQVPLKLDSDLKFGLDSDNYEYRICYRLLNKYEIQSQFKLNKYFNNELILKVITERTMGTAVDLSSSHGVKTSWLNPLYDGNCDVRLTGSSTAGGFTLVGRIQVMSQLPKTIDKLGFNALITQALHEVSKKEYGLTLITGPVRSGKNTTMNGIISNIVQKPLKLIEYSSPIEYIQPFEQLDYNGDKDILLNYIDLAKKQDIDIALINELPRKEVAPAVFDLVNSSIGVMTTFHIDRIWDLPYKLKNYFGEDFIDLITHINGVFHQKMFVKICPHCTYDTYDSSMDDYLKGCSERHDLLVYKVSRGCPHCNGTGRANAVQPYSEFLIFNQDLKSRLLRCDKTYQMEDIIREEVMSKSQSLEHAIAEGIRSGHLTIDDFNKIR